MDIIYRIETYNKQGEFRWGKAKLHAPLNLAAVDYNGIISDDIGIFIPITDNALIAAVSPLAYEIASECDWCFPDPDETKASLFVDLDKDKFNVFLQIEAQPPRWTMEDADGLYVTEETVYAAMDYHSGVDKGECMQTYNLELEADELKQLAWFVIQRLQMVHNGVIHAA